MLTLDNKGHKPGTKVERWVVIYRGEKCLIFSAGFAVFWSICCGACEHTWGYAFEGGQIIFCGVTGKDMHHTSAGPHALVHFMVVQMQMWEAGAKHTRDYWGFKLFISMEKPELCAKVEIDINVESKEHKSWSWTQIVASEGSFCA